MMTDSEVRETITRTDQFIADLREAIGEAIANLNPRSPCVEQSRAALKRINDTLDDVDYVMLANLANINEAFRRRTRGSLFEIVEVHLMAAGSGPELDFTDATALLERFAPLIEMAQRRRIN